MRARLLHVTVKRSGARAVREEIVDVESLRIGRGTDNEISLPGLSVALDHAAIHLRGRLWLETVKGEDLRVDGRVVVAHALEPGNVVRIGHHELRVLASEDGIDVSLEIEQVDAPEAAAAALAERTRIGVERGLLSRRLLSWALGVGGVGALLVLPLLGARGGAFDPATIGTDGEQPRPLAAAWSSGELSASHGHFGDRCEACHVRAFEPVADAACAVCHEGIGRHAEDKEDAHASGSHRCADCHREHQGARHMTVFGDELCSGCHASIAAVDADSDLADAGDFAFDHPEFRVSVVVAPGSADTARVALSDAPVERSGLLFPHDKHLAPDLQAPGAKVTLGCADCHATEPGGRTMKPITFDAQCRRCHALSFDDKDKTREVPHGDLDAVLTSVREFYAAAALEGRATDEDAPEVARRRPGRELTEAERRGVLDWLDGRVARVRHFFLEQDRAICTQCHVLEGGGTRVVAPHVVPFEGAERWMPLALFRHDSHRAADCESCHDARSAKTSEVVLMPTIARCRDCHGGARPTLGKVTSPCTTCHDFHRERFGAMTEAAPPASGSDGSAGSDG